MTARRATEADEATLHALWDEFVAEVPEPDGFEHETWEEEWRTVRADIAGGAVYLAEDDDGPVGVARATPPAKGRSHLQLVYVRPRARRRGVATALLREAVHQVGERGATIVSLDVLWANEGARAVWKRLGFEEHGLFMTTPLDKLAERVAEVSKGESRATTHVQSDERASIDRALAAFVPRLAGPEVAQSANGWVRIADPVLDGDRDAQSRLAHELSERLGAVVVALALEEESVVRFRLYESGRMVDEYLSVPSYHGPVSKADELALQANPTLVARLTGAGRDDVRRVARTAATLAELPPGHELYAQIAQLMGLQA